MHLRKNMNVSKSDDVHLLKALCDLGHKRILLDSGLEQRAVDVVVNYLTLLTQN